MIDSFLKVAYAHEVKRQGQAELTDLLKNFSSAELRKLAEGTPVVDALDKIAGFGCDGDGGTFLDRFKGTPLLDQAIALEQEELQADMLEQQKREQRRAEQQGEDSVYDMKDKIRLKKRMLELELAKSEGAPQPVLGEPAQGAGAPGDVPAEGVQDSSQGLQGGVAKMGGAREVARDLARGAVEGGKHLGEAAVHYGKSLVSGDNKAMGHRMMGTGLHDAVGKQLSATSDKAWNASKSALGKLGSAEEKLAFAEGMGRALAHQDLEKAAYAQMLETHAARAGAAMAKVAVDWGAMGKSVTGLGQKALGAAAKNPAAAGVIAGGVLGGVGGLLGAGLGAVAGHAGGAIQKSRAGGSTFQQAAKDYGTGMYNKAKGMVSPGTLQGPGTPGSTGTQVVPVMGGVAPTVNMPSRPMVQIGRASCRERV